VRIAAVDAPVIINHHKCTLSENFSSTETLRLIDSAAATERVVFDISLYAASSSALMPTTRNSPPSAARKPG
jgi:N-acyl-D-amino-acid deacylase